MTFIPRRFLQGICAVLLISLLTQCKTTQPVTQLDGTSSDHLLWQINGKKLKKTSYLYGTIHIIGADDFRITDAMKEALDETEQLTLELDMDNPMIPLLLLQKGLMKEGKALSDLLSKKEYQTIHQFLVDSTGQPEVAINMMERMQPMLLASLIYPSMLDSEMHSYEMELIELAKANDMEVLGVETVKAQLAVIEKMPYEKQARMLLTLVAEFESEKARTKEMIDIYVAEDLDGLHRLITESDDFGDYQEVMVNERNRNWIPVMEEMMKDKPTFFGVGAGHLWGDQGVINLLREAGYRVEPVR